MRVRLLVLVSALAMALAACSGGGTDDTTDAGSDAPVAEAGAATFVGNDSLQWESAPATAELADGSLEVTIECAGAVPHNIIFEGVEDDAVVAECAGNDSATATLTAEPGTYTYYCAIPGHREAGMEGEITLS